MTANPKTILMNYLADIVINLNANLPKSSHAYCSPSSKIQTPP